MSLSGFQGGVVPAPGRFLRAAPVGYCRGPEWAADSRPSGISLGFGSRVFLPCLCGELSDSGVYHGPVRLSFSRPYSHGRFGKPGGVTGQSAGLGHCQGIWHPRVFLCSDWLSVAVGRRPPANRIPGNTSQPAIGAPAWHPLPAGCRPHPVCNRLSAHPSPPWVGCATRSARRVAQPPLSRPVPVRDPGRISRLSLSPWPMG